jgi:small neutral amino acid transporter SnatA (MarC family)
VAKRNEDKPWKTVTEHVLIAVLVIALTFFIGEKIYSFFGVQ